MLAPKERKLVFFSCSAWAGRGGISCCICWVLSPNFHQRFSPRTEEMGKVPQFLLSQGSSELKKQTAAVPLTHGKLV